MNRIALPYHADSVALFGHLRDLPQAVFLHSSDRGSGAARYDIMAAEPVREIVVTDHATIDRALALHVIDERQRLPGSIQHN